MMEGPPEARAAAVIVPKSQVQAVRQVLLDAGWFDPARKIIAAEEPGCLAVPVNVDSGSGEAFAAAVKHPIVRLALPPSKAKGPPPPHELLKASAASLLAAHGLPKELVSEVPRRWEMHGDLVMLPETAYRGAGWDGIPGAELWSSVAGTLSAKRVARKARIDAGGFRESQAVLLHGKDSEVVHVDNGIKYHYDVLLCMFSAGNISEKLRVAGFDCSGQTVVDLYAGIGYFTLPYLVKGGVDHLHACEWNPNAAAALRRNLVLNHVAERCTVYEGDNAVHAPHHVADRVNLGLIPTSELGWPVAVRALKKRHAGWFHVHENVTTDPALGAPVADQLATFGLGVAASFKALLCETHGGEWSVGIDHVEKVKSYAPHIYHVVYDVRAQPL